MNENVQITHDRLITLENRAAMMAKVIIPVLKDFKAQINNTNDRLIAQYQMMTRAHDRYNRLFRQTHITFLIFLLAVINLVRASFRKMFLNKQIIVFTVVSPLLLMFVHVLPWNLQKYSQIKRKDLQK